MNVRYPTLQETQWWAKDNGFRSLLICLLNLGFGEHLSSKPTWKDCRDFYFRYKQNAH